MFRPTPRRSSAVVLTSLALTLVACEQVTNPPSQLEPAQLAIHANISATTIATMVVRVTGADIEVPLVFNLAIDRTTGTASGAISIPAGSNRRIDLDAFDINQIKTHSGSKSGITVVSGTNQPLSIVLAPLTGSQAVEALLGTFILSVTPANPPPLGVNGSIELTLKILDNAVPTPNEITNPAPNTVAWATTTPAFFKVESTGPLTARVTGLKAGSGEVVVTYNGFAKTVSITVQ
jgi:hypothetical protein